MLKTTAVNMKTSNHTIHNQRVVVMGISIPSQLWLIFYLTVKTILVIVYDKRKFKLTYKF